MNPVIRRLPAACVLSLVLIAPAAHAGLFDDAEARRAILDLRQKQEESQERMRVQQAEAHAQLIEQINQIKRSLLDLNSQLELTRTELAKLRGQDEQLIRDLAEVQRQQKTLEQGVEDRLRKIGPQKVSVDNIEFLADPEEKRQFDEAMAVLRKGDFSGAATALGIFQKRYPGSGYSPWVLFWLGNAHYGKREYRDAMASFRSLLADAPAHPRAAEAVLSIANCQMELKDVKGARRTLDDLVKSYPDSEAAQAGRERIASLK